MTIINHWGKWIDSESPVTGVQAINRAPQALFDELGNSISLGCIDCELLREDEGGCDCCESSGPQLVGSWKKDAAGQYAPDPESGDYAAIVREDVVQVLYSQKTRRGAVCSPCYPGQVDLDSPGEFLAYCLPYEEEEALIEN